MTPTAKELLEATVTEEEFLRAVREFAALRGWLVMHQWMSRHTTAGWPDLAMVRSGRLVLAELKSAKGKVSEDQQIWLSELGAVAARAGGAVEVCVWRPGDWAEIKDVLL